MEAHQDSYFALFAALLNVSVLRSAQPLIAQRGLQVGQERSYLYAIHMRFCKHAYALHTGIHTLQLFTVVCAHGMTEPCECVSM